MPREFEITAPGELRLRAAMVLGPKALARHMNRRIGRVAHVMARTEKREAPKAESTMTNSITPEKVSDFEYTVGPHVDYAEAVELGTDGGGFPPQQSILDWIRVKHIEPDDGGMDEEDLAYVISRSIAARGTPPQPFIEPTYQQHKGYAGEQIDQAIDDTLKEMARA